MPRKRRSLRLRRAGHRRRTGGLDSSVGQKLTPSPPRAVKPLASTSKAVALPPSSRSRDSAIRAYRGMRVDRALTVFVALPYRVAKRVDRSLFRRENVGVIEVEEDEASVVLKPQAMRPKTPGAQLLLSLFLCVERQRQSRVLRAYRP